MEEILLNPGLLGLLAVIIPSFLGFIKYKQTSKSKFYRSNLSMDEKRNRLLRYYQENYHRARMLLIQNGMAELVEKNLPFDPPKDLMLEEYPIEEDDNG